VAAARDFIVGGVDWLRRFDYGTEELYTRTPTSQYDFVRTPIYILSPK
jgi:hypothetical protein